MKSAVNSHTKKEVSLPDSVDDLREIILEKERQINKKDEQLSNTSHQLEKKEQQIEQLLDMIELLRQKQFGRSAEKAHKDQINLFDESELTQFQVEVEEQLEACLAEESAPLTSTAVKKKKPVRRPLPDHLKRIEKIIDLSDEEKAALKEQWTFIGYDSSEQLGVIPRQHYVVVTRRAKYAPNNDNAVGAKQGIKTAPRPAQIIPKALADASVIADVVTAKFVDGLPLYRQEKIYQRDGIDLSRQTMSGWMIQLDEKLSPLVKALKKTLQISDTLHIDETRLQVMNEPEKDNTQQSYMWVYKGGPPDKPVILYQYADSRRASVPVDFLYPDEDKPEHKINIITDGYAGYNTLSQHAGIKAHGVCWAHARRKFIEAGKGRKNTAAAHQMLALINKLYQVEREGKNKTNTQRQQLRQEKSLPLIEKIKTWLDSKKDKVLPKSLLGKAVHYALGLWPKLTVFLKDGAIPIDNNAAENAIRPFVIGRKAWLFSGSPRGARASATLYSLIETAKANDLEPRAYLQQLFEKLPYATSEKDLVNLLPHNIKISD